MQSNGFTLLESIIVIVILIVLFSAAIPFFKKNSSYEIRQVTKQLKQHLELAKSVAVNQQAIVTVCGSSDGKTCDNSWSHGYIGFIDKTGKGVREEGDPLIFFQRYEQQIFDVNWKGFLSQDCIQFSPGLTGAQNGTLTLSNHNGDWQKLIINSVGRIRLENGLN